MTRVFAAVALAVMVTALVYLDDIIAGEEKKRSRYTRVFVLAAGSFWFLMPMMLRHVQGASIPTVSAPLMQQRFDVAPAPF